MNPWMEITIGTDGEVKLEVKGAKGRECLGLTEFLEKGLGEVTERKMKQDIYENRETATQVTEITNREK
jgi:hypothetical protein